MVMRIGLDTSPLSGGHRLRGTGTYTQQLLDSLKKYGQDEVEVVEFSGAHGLPREVDLIHFPYFDPFLLTLPMTANLPTVVTVHDLIPIVFPKYFPRGIRGEIKWQVQRRLLSRADRIITDSVSSKEDISKLVPFTSENIDVIYLAASSQYHTVTDVQLLEAVRKKYTLIHPFLLYVGDVNWNKNTIGLLKAFSLYKTQHPTSEMELLLVGGAFLNDTLVESQQINHLLATLPCRKSVKKLGYVPVPELANLYSQAKAAVQISFAEGFGLPILEAMACGCPVITSNCSSLAEIAGPAIQVDPHHEELVAIAVHKAAQLNLAQYRTNAIDWAKRFTWEKVAKETVLAYQRALNLPMA